MIWNRYVGNFDLLALLFFLLLFLNNDNSRVKHYNSQAIKWLYYIKITNFHLVERPHSTRLKKTTINSSKLQAKSFYYHQSDVLIDYNL